MSAKRVIKSKLALVGQEDEDQKLSITIQIEANHARDIDVMLQGICAQVSHTPGYKLAETAKPKAKQKPTFDGNTV